MSPIISFKENWGWGEQGKGEEGYCVGVGGGRDLKQFGETVTKRIGGWVITCNLYM